ncbi:hypothetical protein TPHV1_10233 [Treponema phagedenis]|uniref:Uncharacterized protein n=1 Tax=Treponema phagedenis TaxID=162 RepID=A0A0B7GUD8_TREPH|nr:hypothetical protein TPHV1_10233 [Treponema phagedenis]
MQATSGMLQSVLFLNISMRTGHKISRHTKFTTNIIYLLTELSEGLHRYSVHLKLLHEKTEFNLKFIPPELQDLVTGLELSNCTLWEAIQKFGKIYFRYTLLL